MPFRHPLDGPRTKPLPVSSLREEPKVADLAAERDRRRSMETPDQLAKVQSSLAEHLQQVQSDLAYLAGAVEPESLASAVVGAMGNAAEEIREQLRPLRTALRDDRGGDAA